MIAAIASQQFLSLRRQRVLGVLGGTMLGVTVLAGVLGWSSHQTIVGVYDEATKLLASRGTAAPPNPFLLKPPLAMLSNMVIYITMIGALAALVLGHVTIADDEASGVGRLLFSRRVTRVQYALGKLGASAAVLGATLISCAATSLVTAGLVNRTRPTAGEAVRILGFFSLSWLYLMAFAVVGMVTVLIARRRSLGLCMAIGVWLVITFAVPQFTSGLRPTQSLNPIVDPVSTSQRFFRATSRARPWSIAEQFKEASGRILATAPSEHAGMTAQRILPLALVVTALAIVLIRLVHTHDFSKGAHRD